MSHTNYHRNANRHVEFVEPTQAEFIARQLTISRARKAAVTLSKRALPSIRRFTWEYDV